MRTAIFVFGVLLCTSLSALAQEIPAVEFSGGYSFLRDEDAEENFHGWVASVTGNVNRWFGVVGEVGGNYKALEGLGTPGGGTTDLDLSVHSFLAGPRFAARQARNVTVFGQLLLGAVRRGASLAGETSSTTDFALQPGGGVDVWVRPNFGIRAGGDYRRIFVEDAGTNEFRFHVGVVVGAGRT